jgi:hypothetical protein
MHDVDARLARPPSGDLSPGPPDPGLEALTLVLACPFTAVAVILICLWHLSLAPLFLVAGAGMALSVALIVIAMGWCEDRRAGEIHARAAVGAPGRR